MATDRSSAPSDETPEPRTVRRSAEIVSVCVCAAIATAGCVVSLESVADGDR